MSGGHYEWCIGEQLPQLGDHSVAKHEIFEQYVGIYIERLTRTPSQTMLNLTIVDGFCGGGLYRRGQSEAEGSPLRLLGSVEQADRALNAARAKGFAVRADFFFVDDKAEHIAFLRDVLIKRGYVSSCCHPMPFLRPLKAVARAAAVKRVPDPTADVAG